MTNKRDMAAGTAVLYYPVKEGPRAVPTRTQGRPWDSGKGWVVLIEAQQDAVPLDQIEPFRFAR